MLDDFPSQHGSERESKILECVRNGRAQYNFVKLRTEQNRNTIELLVFEDALKVDDVRVNVSATTQQQIADLLRCSLPTAKIYDLIWHQCEHRVNPHPRPITSTTKAMIEHSQDIDEDLAELGFPEGLKATVGKVWIIDNSLGFKHGKACNYGWHFDTGTTYKGINGNLTVSMLKNPKTGMFWYMIQPRSWHHSSSHVDYSQVCVLVSRQCWVNGEEKDLFDVFKDPTLASLVNHDGVLHILRQPNVPVLDPIVDLPVQPPPPMPEPEHEPETPIEPVTILPLPENPQPQVPVVAKSQEPTGIWALILWVIKMLTELFSKPKGS